MDNTDNQKSVAETKTLYDIALVKSYSFTQEYNPISGQVEDKHGYRFLKEGYIAGFLAGFTHKFTGDTE
jgi:hypothetical protein